MNRKILSIIFSILMLSIIVTACENSSKSNFKVLGNMNIGRYNHTATLLNDGRVLIIGGNTKESSETAEILDFKTNKFRLLKNRSNVPHSGHSAFLLKDGNVLIIDNTGIEIFDTKTEKFLLKNKMIIPRVNNSCILLPDDKILIIGGYKSSSPLDDYRDNTDYKPNIEIYDSKNNKINIIKSSNLDLFYVTESIKIADNQILIFDSNDGNKMAIFDPQKNKINLKNKFIKTNHYGYGVESVVQLNNGKVLLLTEYKYFYLYDPKTELVSLFKTIDYGDKYINLETSDSELVLLKNGKVAIIRKTQEFNDYIEIFDPTAKNLTKIEDLPKTIRDAEGLLLKNGDLLLTGGYSRHKIISITPSNMAYIVKMNFKK